MTTAMLTACFEHSGSPRNRTRTLWFRAPRWLVYAAFTQPELVRRWWGTSGLTTTCRADLCSRGTFAYASRQLDGPPRESRGIYRLVEPERRLEYLHLETETIVSHIFTESRGQTLVTSTFCPASPARVPERRETGPVDAPASAFERLAVLLTALL